MKTCKEFANDVTELIDGRMPLSGRLKMWIHAAVCTSCQSYRKQMELVKKVAAEISPISCSEHDVDTLSALFEAEQEI